MHGGPVNVTGHPVVDLCVTIAAAIAAVMAIGRFVIGPLWKFQKKVNQTFDTTIPRLADIAEAAPTILTIAAELRNNGGTSIKDSIDRIERSGRATASTLKALSEYTHRSNHKLATDLMVLGGHVENLDIKVTDLTTTVGEQGDLRELLSRWAPTPPTTSPKETP